MACQASAFYWEVCEMLRKFLLVGLFLVVPSPNGSILQVSCAFFVCAVHLMLLLQARPYKLHSDGYLAAATSFALVMIFFCAVIYKFNEFTEASAMTPFQAQTFIVSDIIVFVLFAGSLISALLATGVLVVAQISVKIRLQSMQAVLKYVETNKMASAPKLSGPEGYHIFLSHAWPAGQDQMRIVKELLTDTLPGVRVFLDVDDLVTGSGVRELDMSGCVLAFCQRSYFTKQNSLKELFRAVANRKPILALLDPSIKADGGLDQTAIANLVTDQQLEKYALPSKFSKWKQQGKLSAVSFDRAPSAATVTDALFAKPPLEWHRLPGVQDVTIRLIAQHGVMGSKQGNLYLQGEMATMKVDLPLPYDRREFHIFCSSHNAGAAELATELSSSGVFATGELKWTCDTQLMFQCDSMLVLLDNRTWTSGQATAALVKDVYAAMQIGLNICCAHERPSVVAMRSNACSFDRMFEETWTPAHLRCGITNLYKEIAISLLGGEWRKPGLVALGARLAVTGGPRKPIKVVVRHITSDIASHPVLRRQPSAGAASTRRFSRGAFNTAAMETAQSSRCSRRQSSDWSV